MKFNLDVAVGDYPEGELEEIVGRDWLGFAGIQSVSVLAIPKEQQFAEKIHAYTLPRGEVTNSRVKDLVDLVLLIESKSLVAEAVKNALTKTFRRRKSHDLPNELPPPPETWEARFKKLAEECEIKTNLDDAYQLVREFLSSLSK